MPPFKCPACGGNSFHHDQLKAGIPGAPIFVGGFFQLTSVVASVCLTCGLVSTHVDEAGLAKLQARKPKGNDAEAAV